MDDIEKRIGQCYKDLADPRVAQPGKSVLTPELGAYLSMQLNSTLLDMNVRPEALRAEWEVSSKVQSKHTDALVRRTRALAAVTLAYVVVELIGLWQNW